MSEFLPAAGSMDSLAEDNGLINDMQEGFRRNRSTKRQLGIKHSIFSEQHRRKEGLSAVLYSDIKNAFNVVNRKDTFYVLEAKGFQEADVTLFRRIYTGSFLLISYHF